MFLEIGENRSLELRNEYRLKVSDSRMLRKIFGRKSDEMRGGGTEKAA